MGPMPGTRGASVGCRVDLYRESLGVTEGQASLGSVASSGAPRRRRVSPRPRTRTRAGGICLVEAALPEGRHRWTSSRGDPLPAGNRCSRLGAGHRRVGVPAQVNSLVARRRHRPRHWVVGRRARSRGCVRSGTASDLSATRCRSPCPGDPGEPEGVGRLRCRDAVSYEPGPPGVGGSRHHLEVNGPVNHSAPHDLHGSQEPVHGAHRITAQPSSGTARPPARCGASDRTSAPARRDRGAAATLALAWWRSGAVVLASIALQHLSRGTLRPPAAR